MKLRNWLLVLAVASLATMAGAAGQPAEPTVRTVEFKSPSVGRTLMNLAKCGVVAIALDACDARHEAQRLDTPLHVGPIRLVRD